MRTFEDDDPLFAPMVNALFAAFRGTAVMSGCDPSATGANRNVTVAAGSVQIGGATVAVAGGTVTLDAGGATDRYDLVTVDATGALVATKGTGVRKCPTQPANTCLIAIVFVPAGATVIATGDVYDARMDAPRLSVLNIDADKDWDQKAILNVGRLSAIFFEAYNEVSCVAGDTVWKSIAGPISGGDTESYTKAIDICHIPPIFSGSISIRVKAAIYDSNSTQYERGYMLYKNNVPIAGTEVILIGGTGEAHEQAWDVVSLAGNDIISIWTKRSRAAAGTPVVENIRICADISASARNLFDAAV